jgi:hypothetical protein
MVTAGAASGRQGIVILPFNAANILLGNGCRVNDGGNATSTNIIIILQEHNSGFCHSLLISISFLKIQ